MEKKNTSKPIEDYALIGDGRTAALVCRDGSMDWLCWPRFDSDACFAALLGDERHGRWRLGPVAAAQSSRSYLADTMVLQTEFRTEHGLLRMIDFMPILERGISAVVRRLEVPEGEVEVELFLTLRFGYGEIPPWFEALSESGRPGFYGEVGPDLVVLRGPGLWRNGTALRARLLLRKGKRAEYVLQHTRSGEDLPSAIDSEAALAATAARWQDWMARFEKRTDWPNAVKRSLLTLKALTHHTTGGLIAAPTLGLPERPKGSTNWDYRYCWLRDSTFTLTALLNAGFHEEERAWMSWLVRAVAGSPAKMQTVYRVDGGRQIDERELVTLPGWNGAHPIRIGNAAATQRQRDVYGEIRQCVPLRPRRHSA